MTRESLAAILTQQQQRLDVLEQHETNLIQENAVLRIGERRPPYCGDPALPPDIDKPEPATPLERLSRSWVVRRGVQSASAAAVIAALGQRHCWSRRVP